MAENIAIPHEVQSELALLRDIVGLAAFAVEARRVLQDIDTVAAGIPHIGETLSKAVDVRRQWTECPNTTADVLAHVHWRLGGLLDERAEP